ncbi:MAG: copper homeostasis protein CutC [Chloroflexota bacterium]
MVTVEICLSGIESSVAAQVGGAHRIELCENLVEGGMTPSYGIIAQVRQQLDIDVHVLIRPRPGDFDYTDLEFAAMKQNVEMCKTLGVDGVVIGILDRDGNVDEERVGELVALARPMRVTFHRAFDVARDPFAALETLKSLGIERVLTSGQAPNVWEGRSLLRQLQQQAGDDIVIMAGGDIDADNAQRVVAETAVREIHIGPASNEPVKSKMAYRNPAVYMGNTDEVDEYVIQQVSARRVRAIVDAVSDL